LNLCQQIIELDQALPEARQDRAAAAFAAGGAIDQGMFAQGVHFVDGIPGAFIANAGVFGTLADGAGLRNLFEQGDATGIGKQFLLKT